SAKVIQKSKPRNFSKEIFSGKAKVFANVDKKKNEEHSNRSIFIRIGGRKKRSIENTSLIYKTHYYI
ncbi:hypothetical protein, partial [Prevotella sp. KH2C16]|uniref:hypothetical protein n=1 Tax=Prevotella sp. KH2C16 TaxID=1855325 RepID=UPI001C42FF99